MMPGGGASLLIKILTDASKAQRDLDDTGDKVKGLQGKLGGMVGPASIALGAVGLFAAGAGKAASDVEQSYGSLEAVFGKNADAAKAMAEDAASSTGLASAEYAQMAAVLGAQLRNMGVAEKDLLPITESLIGQGADMAATFGGTTAEAVQSISSLLRGERDPIEKYGVSIKDATLEAELAAQGLGDLTGAAETQAKTQATLALLTQQTASAQGQFAREGDTAAVAQQKANAEFTNAAAALGTVLLPVMVMFASLLGDVSAFVGDNTTVVQILVGVIAALAGGIIALNLALKAYKAVQVAVQAATKVWTGLQWLLNTALAANPIGLVVLAIVALVAIFVVAYNKSETFRRIVDGVFRAVQRIVGQVVGFITDLFADFGDVLGAPFEALVGIVRDVFRTIRGIVEGAVGFITGLLDGISNTVGGIVEALPGGQMAPAPPAAGSLLLGPRGLAVAPVSGSVMAGPTAAGHLQVDATLTHRIEDPGRALAGLPGGAAEVARLLNRGADATGLFRNLQHAGGLR